MWKVGLSAGCISSVIGFGLEQGYALAEEVPAHHEAAAVHGGAEHHHRLLEDHGADHCAGGEHGGGHGHHGDTMWEDSQASLVIVVMLIALTLLFEYTKDWAEEAVPAQFSARNSARNSTTAAPTPVRRCRAR